MIDFKAPYLRKNAISFLSQFLPEDLNFIEEEIKISFQPKFFKKITKLGEVSSLSSIHIYEIIHESENDPRVTLSKDAFRLLANFGVRKALIFFISQNSHNYRLSLVTLDLKWETGKKVEKEYSNPRRYSFFLGPDTKTHTPESYLVKPGRIKDFEDLKKRFSIEIVNKEFYTQIAILFTRLAGGKREIGRKSIDAGMGQLRLPSTSDETLRKEFTVRLIGRILFCWFLKKKRSDKGIALLSESLLSTKAVKENKGYYHSVLELLFFEVLNTSIDKRDDKFKFEPWNQTPFLNGGLFNPHHRDFYDPGPLGISKYVNILQIPDEWFCDLFEVFETYNFTIDENTSVDVELSIEPEMLGRIFENLLAEINPETGETARKATGSFYTPRSIVEYMVDESLKKYLVIRTGLSEKKVSLLLTYSDFDLELSGNEREAIVDALDTIRIIDPACGSGAFPMSVLQKMLLILQKVDPESQSWLDKKLTLISDSALRKELKSKLKADNFNYIHKLGIIRDAIYGVDIQPIAVEISKLRFFLSLIVDERVNDSKENRGIEPLPNLEFKFVCANSLIGLPEKEQKDFFTEATEDILILKNLRDEYLRSSGTEKKKLEKKFLEVQSKMAKHALSWALWGAEKSQTMTLSQWNPFSEDACGWFDPEWMFGITDGFDVVIGNPPYGILNKKQNKSESIIVSDEELAFFKDSKYYEPASGGMINIFRIFILRSIYLLSKNGIFSEIFPLSFVGDLSIGRLRKYILEHNEIISIEAFPERDNTNKRVFEAVKMSVCILNLRNSKTKLDNPFFIRINTDRYIDENAEKNYLTKNIINLIDKENSAFPLTSLKETNFLIKIFSNSIRFSQIGKCNTGEVDMTFGKGCFSDNPNDAKLLKGAIIDRYQLRTKMSQGEIVYIDEKKLFALKKSLSKDFKNQERIVLQGITGVNESSRLKMMIIKDAYCANSLNYLIVNKDIDKKYLLGIFNSKLLNFVFSKFSTNSNVNGYEIDNAPVIINNGFIEPISKLVSFIIFNNHSVQNEKGLSSFFEKLIDALVYELYFSDEIKNANCEVLKYLTDLPELKDNWSDDKKFTVIDKIYKELSNIKCSVSITMTKMQELSEIRIIEGRSMHE